MARFISILILSIICLGAMMVVGSVECDAEDVRGEYGVVLTVNDQPYFTRGKWTGLVNITVTNTRSDKSDTFSLSVTQSPEGWDIILPEPTIEVGTSPPTGPKKTTSLHVLCPNMEKKGTYRMTVKAVSQGDPTKYHSVNIDMEVLLVPRVAVEGPVNVKDVDQQPPNGIPDYREGDPGDYMTYDFRIRNTGNGVESFFLSLESPNNWWHEIQGASFTPPLDINETTIKRVKVRIPENAGMGVSDVLKVIATSQSDLEIYHVGTVETFVRQTYLLGLEAPIYSTYAYPRTEVEIDFNVTNKGNGPDDTVRLEIDSVPPGWIYDFDTSKMQDGGIPRYQKANCILSLLVPESALNMTYRVSFDVYSSAKPVPDCSISFNVTVFQEFSLNLTSKTHVGKVLPGDELVFDFIVENTGNGEDRFALDLKRKGAKDIVPWCSLSTDTIELGDGMSQTLSVTVEIPVRTKAGEYSATLRAVSGGASDMQLVLLETIGFSFEVAQQYALGVEISGGADILVINSDEQTLKGREGLIHFNVTNIGNSKDIVIFEVDYPEENGWSSPDFMISRALLQYGDSRTNLVLSVKAPHRVPAGEYDFSIRVISDTDPSDPPASDSVGFRVRIVRFDLRLDPAIWLDSAKINTSENVTANDFHRLDIRIGFENTGDLRVERFNVSLYINDESGTPFSDHEIFDFEPGASKETSFHFKPTTLGIYHLIFVIDSDGSVSEMDEGNNRVILTYNIELPKPGENGEKKDAAIEMFGRSFDLLEFVLMIISMVLVLVLIGLLLVRFSRSRKKKELVDTGLVEGENYKFRKRGEKATFEGLELDDFFEDEVETDKAVEKAKEDRKGGYYVIGPTSEGTGGESGFTVGETRRSSEPAPVAAPEDYSGWGEEESGGDEWDFGTDEYSETGFLTPDTGEAHVLIDAVPGSQPYEAGRPAFGDSLSMNEDGRAAEVTTDEDFDADDTDVDDMIFDEPDVDGPEEFLPSRSEVKRLDMKPVMKPKTGTVEITSGKQGSDALLEPIFDYAKRQEHRKEKSREMNQLKEIFSSVLGDEGENDEPGKDKSDAKKSGEERSEADVILTKPPQRTGSHTGVSESGDEAPEKVGAGAGPSSGQLKRASTRPLGPAGKRADPVRVEDNTERKTYTRPATKPMMTPAQRSGSTLPRAAHTRPAMRPIMKPATKPAQRSESATPGAGQTRPVMRPAMKPVKRTEPTPPAASPRPSVKNPGRPVMKPVTGRKDAESE